MLSEEKRAWLRQVVHDGFARIIEHSRSQYIAAVAAAQLGVKCTVHTTPRIQELPLESLSLLYWIGSQGTLGADIGLNIPGKDLAGAILIRAITESHCYEDAADAGLILQATETLIERTILARVDETWARPVNRDAAVALIRRLCDRFTIVANSLRDRYDNRPTLTIADEYDVQDLLGALLKTHFTDVRPEEWTPSYAGSASRMDFLLKPERIVVETKTTRKGLEQKQVVTQLAEDLLRYQAHPDCNTLICFVHDPEGRCSSPTALENDLTKDHGPLRVVVIVQPKHH